MLTNLLRPLEYARGNEETLESITLYFTRLVLGGQLVLTGIQLLSRHLRTEWRSLAYLLGPGMCAMWISTALLVWALVPNIPFVYALAVGTCVTPYPLCLNCQGQVRLQKHSEEAAKKYNSRVWNE